MTKRRNLAWALVGVLCAALVVVMLAAVLTTARLVTEIRTAQETSRNVLDAVKSCTTPGRSCFEQGQEQTADAVGDINRITLFAAACADQPRQQRLEEIQACVIRRLATDQP